MGPSPARAQALNRYADWGLQDRQDAGITALLDLAQRTTVYSRPDQQGHHAHDIHRGSTAGSWRQRGSLLAGVTLVAALVAVWYLSGSGVLVFLMLGAAAFNMVVASLEVRWRLYAWRTPEAAMQLAWPQPVKAVDACMRFSLIVPARDEAAVIGDTLRGLVKQDHPHLQIIVSLCDDDDATIAAASRVMRSHPDRIRLVTGQYSRSSKAHQLNAALPFCTGDVVGVIDAEDDVAPTLLRHVEALFLTSGSDVVQGGVQLMNLGDSIGKWFQVHNILEYFYWFTSRMAYQVHAGFVPLGGNTVFVYRELLNEAGGWPVTLTEDCALGVVLATEFGATVAAAYSPELSTREESPPTIFNKKLGSLFWQRDRWVRGFVTELVGRKWLKMPTLRARILAGYILATPLLQSIAGILLPFAVVTALVVKAPIGLTLLMFMPLIPIGITALTQLVGLREFARTYQQKARIWHYASVLFLAPLYQAILATAATVAVYKYAKGDTRWYKTGRAAEHRERSVMRSVEERSAA
jgi:cellulose synthase/poly-beta-1,6-N-acetylglucosamine synthase-like glycosyltransferase